MEDNGTQIIENTTAPTTIEEQINAPVAAPKKRRNAKPNPKPVADAQVAAPAAPAKKKVKKMSKVVKKVAKVVKAKPAKTDKKPKSDAVVAKEKENAKSLGLGVRCFRILKALHHPEARLSPSEIAAKTGIDPNHLSGQLWGDGKWGAGEDALGKEGVKNEKGKKRGVLIRRYEDPEGGYRVGLTALGAKFLEKVK